MTETAAPARRVTRTRVGIIGGGPAGLMLSHLLSRAGIDNVVLESRDHDTIAATHRAGILEQPSVDMLVQSGVDGRIGEVGDEHAGIDLRIHGESHPLDFPELVDATVTLYAQNEVFLDLLARGIDPYPGSVRYLDALDAAGIGSAVVSSSRNARGVLAAAGLADRFEVVVDGVVAAERGLPGKPRPDTYTHAAELLGVPTARCVVVEDAESGVQAGAAGDFAHVVGVDRGTGRDRLRAAGADVVVDDLGELVADVRQVRR